MSESIQITVKTELTLTPEFLGDVMVTAFDGAHGYSWDAWAMPATDDWLEKEGDDAVTEIWTKVVVKDKYGDEPDVYTVTHETLAKGIQRILDDKPVHMLKQLNPNGPETVEVPVEEAWAHWSAAYRALITNAVITNDAGEVDGGVADDIVQAGVLGHVIYG